MSISLQLKEKILELSPWSFWENIKQHINIYFFRYFQLISQSCAPSSYDQKSSTVTHAETKPNVQ